MATIEPTKTEARSLLIKPASGDCNLHCTYCFYHDRATDPYKQTRQRRMSPDVLDELIRQGMQFDRQQATFGWQGGEPTLAGLDFFKRAVALQKQYGASGQAVSNGLQTNGILLDADWARFLRQYNVLVGVSLDGPAEYHDRYRGNAAGAPTHARVIDSLRMLTQHNVEFNVLSVVNRLTGDHATEIYDYFVSEGFTFMQFIPCVEVDQSTGQITDFSVDPAQYGDFLCALFDRWFNGGSPEASIRDFDAILAVYMGQPAPLCCYQERCGSYLVVEYNGDMYPCDFLVKEDLYLGNLLTTTLADAFESAALSRFAAAKAKPRPECTACAWLPFCHQNCPRLLDLDGGKRYHLCRSYQKFYAHSHEGFLHLRTQVLKRMGVDPESVPKPPLVTIGRNDPCPCGSGKKYKRCCAQKRRVPARGEVVRE